TPLTRDQLMPPPGPRSREVRGRDRMTFEAMFVVETFLYWAFLSAIALGTARVVWVTSLALVAAGRPPPRANDSFRQSVSVLIAAYNERTAIARTLQAVLEGDELPLEIIVVDDGSTDGTIYEVAR